MNKLSALCSAIILLSFVETFGQGVGISSSTITPHSSSILELRTTNQGFLCPRMTADQRIAITTPATGLLVYDTDSSFLMVYTGSKWEGIRLTTTTSGGGSSQGLAFKAVAGNATNGLAAYNAFAKLPFMNINTVGYNVGSALSNDGKAIFTTPAGGGVFHFEVRLHFSADQACQANYGIRFLTHGSIATDAQKNGILTFKQGFDIQEAYCSKDFLLSAGDTVEVEYSISTPTGAVGSFWMVGSVGNLTSTFSGNRTLAF